MSEGSTGDQVVDEALRELEAARRAPLPERAAAVEAAQAALARRLAEPAG